MKIPVLLVSLAVAAGTFPLAAEHAQVNWDKECAKCHGKDGSGQTTMGKRLKLKDYTSAEVQSAFTDEEAVKAIKEGVQEDGKTRMKAYADKYTEEEIKALVAHVRSLKK